MAGRSKPQVGKSHCSPCQVRPTVLQPTRYAGNLMRFHGHPRIHKEILAHDWHSHEHVSSFEKSQGRSQDQMMRTCGNAHMGLPDQGHKQCEPRGHSRWHTHGVNCCLPPDQQMDQRYMGQKGKTGMGLRGPCRQDPHDAASRQQGK